MSSVSAVLTVYQFQQALAFGNRLDDSSDSTDPDAMEAYISERIDDLTRHVNTYLRKIDKTVDYENNLPPGPDPDFNLLLGGLPNLIYWVRFANLRILNTIKWKCFREDIPPSLTDRGTLLGPISRGYLTTIADSYEIEKDAPAERRIETNIVEIAILVSMNNEMLQTMIGRRVCFDSDHPLLYLSLERYQNLTIQLHDAMARYMQVQTRHLFVNDFEALKNKIDASVGIVRGINNIAISDYVVELSRLTLSAIAIYGLPTSDGTELICGILHTNQALRHFIRLYARSLASIERLIDRLLAGFGPTLLRMEVAYPVGHTWIPKIRPLLGKLSDMRYGRI
jgi:hypothetical protein